MSRLHGDYVEATTQLSDRHRRTTSVSSQHVSIRPANPGLIGHAPLSLRRGRPAAVSRRRAAG